jgi:hypothetical protein
MITEPGILTNLILVNSHLYDKYSIIHVNFVFA